MSVELKDAQAAIELVQYAYFKKVSDTFFGIVLIIFNDLARKKNARISQNICLKCVKNCSFKVLVRNLKSKIFVFNGNTSK